MADKTYLGDAVYAKRQDGFVVLTTEDGIGASNTIYLEGSTLYNLLEWLRAECNIQLIRPVPEIAPTSEWGSPDPDYACGAAFCDDPACNTHAPKRKGE